MDATEHGSPEPTMFIGLTSDTCIGYRDPVRERHDDKEPLESLMPLLMSDQLRRQQRVVQRLARSDEDGPLQ